MNWTRGEQRTGSAGGVTERDGRAVTLLYRHDGQDVAQRVQLTTTPCHYGGCRPWWLCPACGRRVAVLYAGRRVGATGGAFACRHCHRLCYAVQLEGPIDRAIRRAHNIEDRLGPHQARPKGMHSSTYTRLLGALGDAEWEWSHLVAVKFGLYRGRSSP